MSKSQGVAHRVFDEVVKFKTMIITDIGKFKTEVITAIKDISEKHNMVAAQAAALEQMMQNVTAFIANEMGKTGGNMDARFASVAKSLRGTDLNILAMAQMIKEVLGQLTQIDAILQKSKEAGVPLQLDMTSEDVERIKAQAEEWNKSLIISSFRTAQEDLQAQEKKQDEEYAAQQKAKEEAGVASAEHAVQAELTKIAAEEQALTTTTSGGPGTPFPEGAEVWGG